MFKHFIERIILNEDGFIQGLIAMAPSLISAGSSIAGLFGKKKKSNLDSFVPPEYWNDPNFTETQGFLKNFGMDLLGGKVPDYFKAIGETNSPEFNDYLGLTNKGIANNAYESAALTNRGRGGGVNSMVSRLIADNTTTSRFADYQRALEGKGKLLDTGVNVTGGVRDSALTNMGYRNNFNLKTSGMMYDFLKDKDAQDAAAGAAKGSMVSNLVGQVFGAGKTNPGGLLGSLGSIFTKKAPASGLLSSNIGIGTMDLAKLFKGMGR